MGSNIVVNTLNDTNVPGLISLREAITEADAAGGNNNTITFAAGLTGTIVLNSSLPLITTNLTIGGSGQDITISGNGSVQVFTTLGAGLTVTIKGLAIESGNAGPGNGGGISVGSGDTLTLENSTVKNCQAAVGGGIYVGTSAALTLANTTISNNSSQGSGGGIGLGTDASATLINATITGNVSAANGGGIYGANSNVITLYDSTLFDNAATGAGNDIDSLGGGSLTLANSIVANELPVGVDLDLGNSPLVVKGNNILGSNPANAISIDTTGGSYVVGNPMLGPLANNGGPVQTRALLPGSIALDAGSNAALPPDTYDLNNNGNTTEPLPVDARGLPRVSGPAVDIGAFEFQVRSLAGQMALNAATEDLALANNTSVATFSDTNASDVASDFAASISWGDGTPTSTGSAVTIVGSNGSFTVEGGHTYADEGKEQASVTLTHTADQLQSTVSGSVAVAENDVLTDAGDFSFVVDPGQVFSGPVGFFADSDTANARSDFAASIDWGDGHTTTGTISTAGLVLKVSGSHTYTAPGQDTVKVTLADDAPGTASTTATTTALVANTVPFDLNGDSISDLVFQNNGQPGIWLWNGTATTAEVGLTNPGASWHIVASRDVNGDGKADLIWQNNDGTPGIWLMNGTTPIAEVGLPNPGPSWNLVAAGDVNGDGKADLIWQDFSGNLGVWLMNGTSPIAEAGIGNPGTHWNVVGTADFNGDHKDDILLQNSTTGNLMIDLMNGTTISSTKTITVGDPSWHAVSAGVFNGQAEIAWQNNNGQAGIWLMNGTTPAAEVGLSNPGAGWQLVSIDHFTPNGQADLLFQNTNGNALMLWEMNGTSVAAMVNLPNPGAGWQSVNGHPFATG